MPSEGSLVTDSAVPRRESSLCHFLGSDRTEDGRFHESLPDSSLGVMLSSNTSSRPAREGQRAPPKSSLALGFFLWIDVVLDQGLANGGL